MAEKDGGPGRGGSDGHLDHEVGQSVSARARALEADILADSDPGKQVLALRHEKGNRLDTTARVKIARRACQNSCGSFPRSLHRKTGPSLHT